MAGSFSLGLLFYLDYHLSKLTTPLKLPTLSYPVYLVICTLSVLPTTPGLKVPRRQGILSSAHHYPHPRPFHGARYAASVYLMSGDLLPELFSLLSSIFHPLSTVR